MINQIVNIGIGFQETRLNILRQKSINVFSLAFIMVMLVSMGFRILGGEFYVVLVTLVSIAIMFLSFYFSSRNKLDYSIFISAAAPIILIVLVASNNKLSCVNLVGPLIMVIIVFLLIIRKETLRWFFLVLCLLILIWIALNYGNTILFTASLATQVFGICLGFIYFVRHMETQDLDLNTALKNEFFLNEKLSVKNDDLKTFSHIMAHDLKTPIRHIKGFSELIRKSSNDLNEKLIEYLSIIETSASNMETLVADLLNLQKIDEDSIQFENIDLNLILKDIENTYCYEAIDQVNKMIYKEIPIISGDKRLIKILFNNLISNSFKYQPLNEVNHIPTVTLSWTTSNNVVNITIVDNGIGISQEHIEIVFEPFKRLHNSKDYKGTGLGLSICKKIMQKHRGKIEITNSNSNGTTFSLSFIGCTC